MKPELNRSARSALGRIEPEVRPQLLHLGNASERAEIDRLIADPAVEIHDTIQGQLRELVLTREPDCALSADERSERIVRLLNGRTLAEYGVWASYPWSRRLVHLLGREEFIELRTSRNRYLLTPAEQAQLAEKRIGVVGLSLGDSVALAIALERSCGELRLADHETLEVSDLNRVRAGLHQVGLPKVAIAAREISELDPYLKVTCFFEGLTAVNVGQFFLEGGCLDLVVDECDGLDMKVRLREGAVALRLPVLMQTNDRGLLDIERFDLEPDRPLFHGLAGDLHAADLRGLTDEQKAPYVLKILGAAALSSRMRASLREVDPSVPTWPQIGSAVALSGGVAADGARRVLLGQLRRSGRFHLDLGALISDEAPGLVAAAPRVSDALISRLVARAIRAPSGGNHQPWKWVASGQTLFLFDDPEQHMGITDFNNLGTAVALGAAAETLVLAAHCAGVELQVEVHADEALGAPIATLELNPTSGPVEGHEFDALEEHIEDRGTDRTMGDRTPLPAAAWEALQVAARSIDGVGLHLVTDCSEIDALAAMVGQGERLRLLDPTLSREMFDQLRWTQTEAENRGDGIEVDSLDLSAADRAGLERCRQPGSLALLSEWGAGAGLAKLGRRAASACSGLGLITVKPADRASYFRAGRAVQRLWLTALAHDLALHPMSFLPYAFARLMRGSSQGFAPSTEEGIANLRLPYARLLGLDGTEGEVLLFRVFPTRGPVPASYRRPVSSVLRFKDPLR